MARKEFNNRSSVSHPLNGSNIGTLLTLFRKNRPVSTQFWRYVLSALGRWPFTALEQVIAARKIEALDHIKPPVFIVGHWRSGTTHLGNILSKASQFGYVSPIAAGIPWDLLTLGTWFRPLLEHSLPSTRLIDRVKVNPDSPQEDEYGIANMFPISFAHALYFPQKFEEHFTKGVFFDGASEREIEHWKQVHTYYLTKIYIDQNEIALLIRNPVYTGRIPMLKELWPGARFIHIYRNPYRIFPSMQNFFRKLLPAFSLQDYHHVDIDEVVFKTYDRLMSKIIHDASTLVRHEFIEISYEELDNNPLIVLGGIYDQLELENFDLDKENFEKYLDSVKGYERNLYAQDDATKRLIEQRWGRFIEHFGYARGQT
jgi:hypothetical protein